MSYTLEASGDERALADWGIDADSALLVFNSFEADQFSFALQEGGNALAALPFTYGQQLKLRQNGTVKFVGTVRDRPVFGSINKERQRFVAYNFWHGIEANIYQQNRNLIDNTFSTLTLTETSQVVHFRSPSNGAKISTYGEVANLCAYAGLPVTLDFTGVTPPFQDSNDLSVAEGIRRAASWQPDLLARADYSGEVPALHILDRAAAGTRALDVTAGALLSDFECRRRDDLVPRGVRINFITTLEDEATGLRYSKLNADSGGSLSRGEYVIVATLNIGDGEAVPYGLAAAYYASLQTCFLEGSFSLGGFECDLSWAPGDLLDISNGLTEWADCIAPITEVSHQLVTGNTVVKFGPPQFLGLANFIALNSRVKDSQNNGKPTDRAGDGTGGDNQGTHDNGVAGFGTSGGSPSSESIGHCQGGTQKNTRVLKP